MTQSVLLEIDSGDKGTLLSRTHTGAISSPVKGLLIYDTLDNSFKYYDGGEWQTLMQKITSQFYYLDKDGDTYGDSLFAVYAPMSPGGYVANKSDCDDSNAGLNPSIVEVCDGIDNDCDGIVDDGIDFQNDINNCGSCGNLCSSQNTSSVSCDNGNCMLICLPGYADCDGDPSNGCETDISSNPQHCGGCGQSCIGECVAFSCEDP